MNIAQKNAKKEAETMRKEMEEKIFQSTEVDAILLTSPANMRFVAGFTGEGYVYFSRRQKVVVTDSRYVIAAKNECPGYEIETWTSDGYFLNLLAHLKEEESVKRLGIEDEVMTVSLYHKLEKQLQKNEGKSPDMISLENKMNQFRQIKTEKEQERIRQAEAIGDRAFTKTIAKIHEGMTEKQVAAWLEFYMKEEGAEGFSFDTIAASGEHSAMPHAIPTDKKLENGDFLTMDFGCLYQGYCSDMTRTVVIGSASEKQREIYDTVLKAQETALLGIRPGMKGSQIDAMARDVITDAGYGKYFGHALGHSVGLEIHESPNFSPREETVIKPGMVITVEPGIYIEGIGGVRIEDVVIITEDGCENITHSTKKLLELTAQKG